MPNSSVPPLTTASETSVAGIFFKGTTKSTKTGAIAAEGMPDASEVSAARSSMRSLPTLSLGGSFGKSGCTITHSSPVTSGLGRFRSILSFRGVVLGGLSASC